MYKKVLLIAFYVVSIAFFAWIAGSYLDIIADNIAPEPVHWEYNFFVMLTKAARG